MLVGLRIVAKQDHEARHTGTSVSDCFMALLIQQGAISDHGSMMVSTLQSLTESRTSNMSWLQHQYYKLTIKECNSHDILTQTFFLLVLQSNFSKVLFISSFIFPLYDSAMHVFKQNCITASKLFPSTEEVIFSPIASPQCLRQRRHGNCSRSSSSFVDAGGSMP